MNSFLLWIWKQSIQEKICRQPSNTQAHTHTHPCTKNEIFCFLLDGSALSFCMTDITSLSCFHSTSPFSSALCFYCWIFGLKFIQIRVQFGWWHQFGCVAVICVLSCTLTISSLLSMDRTNDKPPLHFLSGSRNLMGFHLSPCPKLTLNANCHPLDRVQLRHGLMSYSGCHSWLLSQSCPASNYCTFIGNGAGNELDTNFENATTVH